MSEDIACELKTFGKDMKETVKIIEGFCQVLNIKTLF